jgi:hypothetical protein
MKIELPGTATVTGSVIPKLTFVNPKASKAKELRGSIGMDLERLKKLSKLTAISPIVAMLESWASLRRVIVETLRVCTEDF